MVSLNGLEAHLPPEQPPTDQTIENLNNEISSEFKTAANSVAKLYRLSNEKNSLLKHQGYLRCLDDLLELMNKNSSNTPTTESACSMSVHDLKLWCMKRKSDLLLLPHDQSVAKPSLGNEPANPFGFTFKDNTTELKSPNFRLSMTPPSIEYQKTTARRKKKSQRRAGKYDLQQELQSPNYPTDNHIEKKTKLSES